MTSNLSPSQKKIVEWLKRDTRFRLPQGAVVDDTGSNCSEYWQELHTWAWSWQICQEIKTADYRKRLSELRVKGYDVRSFHVGKRYGYVLVSEPEPQMSLAMGER